VRRDEAYKKRNCYRVTDCELRQRYQAFRSQGLVDPGNGAERLARRRQAFCAHARSSLCDRCSPRRVFMSIEHWADFEAVGLGGTAANAGVDSSHFHTVRAATALPVSLDGSPRRQRRESLKRHSSFLCMRKTRRGGACVMSFAGEPAGTMHSQSAMYAARKHVHRLGWLGRAAERAEQCSMT
jgi:hypothetical protein